MNPPKTPFGRPRAAAEFLSDEQFAMFRNFLYGISGIFIPDANKYALESRIKLRMQLKGIERPIEYLSLLKMQNDNDPGSELYVFIDKVTVHETSFFRGESQLESIRDHLLPEFIERQRKNGAYHLNIWSAGCSTGEEPYTIAIILRELLAGELDRWRLELIATDISPSVIKKAKEALYGELELGNVAPDYLERYFTEYSEGVYRLNREVTDMVTFKTLNLRNDSEMESISGQHAIFCRNTLIYIGEQAKEEIAVHFEQSLAAGGCLVLGQTESLHGVRCGLEMEYADHLTLYRKARVAR